MNKYILDEGAQLDVDVGITIKDTDQIYSAPSIVESIYDVFPTCVLRIDQQRQTQQACITDLYPESAPLSYERQLEQPEEIITFGQALADGSHIRAKAALEPRFLLPQFGGNYHSFRRAFLIVGGNQVLDFLHADVV